VSIPKLSQVVTLAVRVSDMAEQLSKQDDWPIDYQSSSIKDISVGLQALVQELLVLQQAQDSALATMLGED